MKHAIHNDKSEDTFRTFQLSLVKYNTKSYILKVNPYLMDKYGH